MASIIKIMNSSHVINFNRAVAYQVVRNAWNKDFKPGPYPNTLEERAAAAKKYNLSPDEYEPYPDDGTGYGDYPKLPAKAVEGRDPFYPWDFPEHKRNFGEPVPVDVDFFGEDRINVNDNPRFSFRRQLLSFLGVMAACYGIFLFGQQYRVFRPALPKQYPNQGKTHYTFEPAT